MLKPDCKHFFIFGIITLLVSSCAPPENITTKFPTFHEKDILKNSTSISSPGPIPEWVEETKKGKDFQIYEDVVFVVFFKETTNPTSERFSQGEISSMLKDYLSRYTSEYSKLSEEIILELSGIYWHKLRNGKTYYFARYAISRESLKTILKKKNYSEKTLNFIQKLLKEQYENQ